MKKPITHDQMDGNRKSPVGTIHVFDPSPLNWLYILFNTMEEAVRADHKGKIIPSLAQSYRWVTDTIFELKLHKEVVYQNNEHFYSGYVRLNFHQLQRWIAPHPPGTWLNLSKETTLEILDNYTVRFHFPKPDGLAPAKMRAHHLANKLFWQTIGFGYAKLGSAEGHW
ncbi:ABC transporter substrate-binding protein [Pseudalkalibacillus decolorationis]|uniref:ABC transporter substrate-binding protein n=1 Tax=Pseudalkalibacillus decolorationis TaxID=163879 RepID=UPI002148BB1B|nr:ABC transporter substrate-binding protein [Pseudalkalibacillus decolorationis]